MSQRKEQIVAALKDKACLKQLVYRNTLDVFNRMREAAEKLAEELDLQFMDIDKHVRIHFNNVNDLEFHLKFSGDLLMFNMHSNITAFPANHILNKSPWIQEDKDRGYYGSIMIYNFMADSVKYNRVNDPGYLVARMMLNRDEHFYIEGVRQLNFLHPDISKNKISDEIIHQFIESAMLVSIGNDLIAPELKKIQFVPLGAKLANQVMSGGEKVGFVMSHEHQTT